MATRGVRKGTVAVVERGYDQLLADVVVVLEHARSAAARSVNSIMTATYWDVGRRIVEREQGGSQRAEYGRALIRRLAQDLTRRFGRGFGWRNLFQMRAFYLAFPEKLQTLSAKSTPEELVRRFPLPWSHYVRLLSVKNIQARAFYETEALRGGWTARQLDRQISTQFYERVLLSRNKAALLERENAPRPEDVSSAEEEIKDPYVLEFLGLKDEYSENDLEEALIRYVETFLLELGGRTDAPVPQLCQAALDEIR